MKVNRVILIGYITKKPELRYAGANLPIANFTLAVNRIKEGTDFINITVFNKQAENVEKYTDKGSLVAIEGRIQVSNYKKEDKTLYKTEIIADNVRFLSSKGNSTPEAKESSKGVKNGLSDKPFEEFAEQIEIDNELGW